MEDDTQRSETIKSEPHCEEAEDNCVHAQVEALEAEETRGVNLADEQCHPSVSVEVEGDMQDRRTDSGKEGEREVQTELTELSVQDIVASESLDKLAKAITENESLSTARKLADDQ